MAMPLKREIPRTAALPAEPGDKTQRPKSSSRHMRLRAGAPARRSQAKKSIKPVVSALRDRRRKAGYATMSALAEKVGCSLSRISQMERGIWKPGGELLKAYAQALNCTTEEIMRDFPAWEIMPWGGNSYRRKGLRRRAMLPPEFYDRAKRVLSDLGTPLEDWLVEIGTEWLDRMEGVD